MQRLNMKTSAGLSSTRRIFIGLSDSLETSSAWVSKSLTVVLRESAIFFEALDTNIFRAAFYVVYIGTMQSGFLRQNCLRHTHLFATLADDSR